jgi:hypothetical protein
VSEENRGDSTSFQPEINLEDIHREGLEELARVAPRPGGRRPRRVDRVWVGRMIELIHEHDRQAAARGAGRGRS